MTEKQKYDQQEAQRAEKVGVLFEQIEILLRQAVELGASNQRLKLGLQYMYNKYTRRR